MSGSTIRPVDRTDTDALTIITVADRYDRKWTLVCTADGQDFAIEPGGGHIALEAGMFGPVDGLDRTTFEEVNDWLVENS